MIPNLYESVFPVISGATKMEVARAVA